MLTEKQVEDVVLEIQNYLDMEGGVVSRRKFVKEFTHKLGHPSVGDALSLCVCRGHIHLASIVIGDEPPDDLLMDKKKVVQLGERELLRIYCNDLIKENFL